MKLYKLYTHKETIEELLSVMLLIGVVVIMGYFTFTIY